MIFELLSDFKFIIKFINNNVQLLIGIISYIILNKIIDIHTIFIIIILFCIYYLYKQNLNNIKLINDIKN